MITYSGDISRNKSSEQTLYNKKYQWTLTTGLRVRVERKDPMPGYINSLVVDKMTKVILYQQYTYIVPCTITKLTKFVKHKELYFYKLLTP